MKNATLYTPKLVREVYDASIRNGNTVKQECAARGLTYTSLQSAAVRFKMKKNDKPQPKKKANKKPAFVDIDLGPPQVTQVSQDMVAIIMVPRTSLRSVVEGLWQS